MGHVGLDLANTESSEVEDRRREHGVGLSFLNAIDKVVKLADPATGDYRRPPPDETLETLETLGRK